MQGMTEKLSTLRQLKETGEITEADFEREKQKLLDQLTGGGAIPSAPAPAGTNMDLSDGADQVRFLGPSNRQYRIERSLGKGSFGEVFLAEDIETSLQLGAVT